MAGILIIDDDQLMSEMLCDLVRKSGHEVIAAYNLHDGFQAAENNDIDVIFLDVNMPDGNGLEALTRLRAMPSAPEIIIITAYGDPDGAELAIRSGAWDYIEKVSSIGRFTLPLMRALQYRQEKKKNHPNLSLNREGIVGTSTAMSGCLSMVSQAAMTDVSVLILGETGTGKEIIARAIHANSARKEREMVTIDCASLPPSLIESVLFGHEKGAFTGANTAHEGLIRQADGGTLYLDEIGDLPLPLQKEFLRVIQEHQFRPVGSKKEVTSDFRFIAATNCDLEEMVAKEQFRSDLYYRIRSLIIPVPPLRERNGDIKELCFYFTEKLCQRYGKEIKGFSPNFFETIAEYKWPGNVREMLNALESAIVVAVEEPMLFKKHLPEAIRIAVARNAVGKNKIAKPVVPASVPTQSLKQHRDEAILQIEKNYLLELMRTSQGNIMQACKLSGLSRPRLYGLMKKYSISRKDNSK
jgi:two-component system NtrC family response regulator